MITVETLGSSSAGNAYRLRSGGRSLLIECGLPWKEIRRKLNFETTNLDGCLVGHSHNDHAKAISDVLKSGIKVYASIETFSSKGCSEHHNACAVSQEQGGVIISDYWEVIPFDTVHDVDGSLGFFIEVVEDRKIDRLVFITDTAYCKYVFPPCNVLMIEANYSSSILSANVDAGRIEPARARRVRENHLSIERVIDFLKANDMSKCRAIHLLHLSDGNSNAQQFKQMVQESTGIPTFVEA